MAQTIDIPIPAQGARPLAFPDRCACCGRPKAAESTLLLKRLVMRGRKQQQLTVRHQIPHCHDCARSTKAVFLAGCIPFVLGVIVVGGLAFAVTALKASALGLDTVGRPVNANSLVVGAAAGLLAGVVGGFLFEVLARVILLPVFGRALLRAPLLAAQLISDADYVAGVTARLTPDASRLRLIFANDDIAAEFKILNRL